MCIEQGFYDSEEVETYWEVKRKEALLNDNYVSSTLSACKDGKAFNDFLYEVVEYRKSVWKDV